MDEKKIWTVSEVNSSVKEVIEGCFMPIWLQAEVGTLLIHRSGHVYLTLKDSVSQIRAAFFGGAEQSKKLKLAVGSQVEVFGKLTVYEPKGEYQFTIKMMRLKGVGDLQKQFEELKKKLAAEGLFDESRKKPIPVLPRRIGVVTSPDGAAIRDFLQIINRRFPNINIKIYPAPVQGKGAEKELAKGIKFFNRTSSVDVIIITRGGGSLEDLWPFNEEVLAREISASKIPVISAVGHEVDFTICDFVSDLRVSTPSAAAELVIGRQDEFQSNIVDFRRRIASTINLLIERFKRRFENASRSYVFREPTHLIRDKQQKIDELFKSMETAVRFASERFAHKIMELNGRLKTLNPKAVLERGYAILTEKETNKIIMSPDIPEGTPVTAFLAKGTLDLKVTNLSTGKKN